MPDFRIASLENEFTVAVTEGEGVFVVTQENVIERLNDNEIIYRESRKA